MNEELSLIDTGENNVVLVEPAAAVFTPATVVLNHTVCRLRLLVAKLGANFAEIDTVYAKVSLGGMARESSLLVSEVIRELDALQGLCWAAINTECEPDRQLSFEQWCEIGHKPATWLREVFEAAEILDGIPDEVSMGNIAKGQCILVIRAIDKKGTTLLPQVAALMPEGFDAVSTQVWWPWVMGGEVPVMLVPTQTKNVFQEVSAAQFLQFPESALV